jgi:hypothetical protein
MINLIHEQSYATSKYNEKNVCYALLRNYRIQDQKSRKGV